MDARLEEITIKRYIAKSKPIVLYEVLLPITKSNKKFLDNGYTYEIRKNTYVVSFWNEKSLKAFERESGLVLEEFENVKHEHYHSCP